MEHMTHTPKSYSDCKVLLDRKNRDKFKLGNNTWVYKSTVGDYYAIVYHATEIVQFHANGMISIHNGGWQTSSTKERINQFIPRGYVYQKNYNWYMAFGIGQEVPFENGMMI